MDAKSIADRYIARGGGKPVPTRDEVISDILDVACFVGWHEGQDMMGGRTAEQAFDALCRLVNINRVDLTRIVRGETQMALSDPAHSEADDDDLPF